MCTTHRSLIAGIFALVLAFALAPSLAFAEEEGSVLGDSSIVSHKSTDIAKDCGMNPAEPMDLNKLIQNTPGTSSKNGVYVMQHVLTLEAGEYYLSDDLSTQAGTDQLKWDGMLNEFREGLGAESGLAIGDGAEVTIRLNGHTLTVKGNDASNGTGGGNGGDAFKSNGIMDGEGADGPIGWPADIHSQPGIFLPEGATLIIAGSGTLNATGGKAGNGGNGGNGGAGYAMTHLLKDEYHGGGKGAPGSVGPGASPGIGTRGGGGCKSWNDGRLSGHYLEQPYLPAPAGALKVQEDRKGSITLNLQGGAGGTTGRYGKPGQDVYFSDWMGSAWGGGGGAGAGSGGGGAAPGYGSGGQGGIMGQMGAHGQKDADEQGSHLGGADLPLAVLGWTGKRGVSQNIEYLDPLEASYDVEFYYQVQGLYLSAPVKTEVRYGAVNDTVSLTADDKDPAQNGYAFDEQKTVGSVKVAADGSAKLKVYFKQSFTVAYECGDHGVFADGRTAETYSGLDYDAFTPEPPEVVADDGWVFDGWVVEDGTFGWSGRVLEDATYVAVWKEEGPATYAVEYFRMKDDGTYSEEADEKDEGRTAKAGSRVQVTGEDLLKGGSGYVFDKFAAGNELNGTVSDDGELTLKVCFAKSHKVTYKPGEHGTFPDQVYDQVAYVPGFEGDASESAETGWEFAGWSPAANVDDPISDDVEYVAQWQGLPTKYAVTSYFMVDGTYDRAIAFTQFYNGTSGEEIELSAEQMEAAHGYVLDDSQSNMTKATLAGDGTTTFKLYFKQALSVTFDSGEHGTFADGATKDVRSGLPYGDATPEAPQVTAEDGWAFTGWSPALAEKVDADATYTATYQRNPHTAYKVEIYYEKRGYDSPVDVFSREGTWGDKASVTQNDLIPRLAGHVLDESADNVFEGEIAKDGSLVLKVYFKQTPLETHHIVMAGGSANHVSAAAGAQVAIKLGPVPEGKTFDSWKVVSGDVTIADETSANTTFIMGNKDVVIAAQYKDANYGIHVIGGTANFDKAVKGDTVELSANSDEIPSGARFDHWMDTYGNITYAKQGESETTFTMPGSDVWIQAVYVSDGSQRHSVGVAGGFANFSEASEGDLVTVTLGSVPEGKAFDKWVAVQGAVTLSGETETTMTFVMPDEDVSIAARYVDLPAQQYAIHVYDGSANLAEAAAGTEVSLVADPAPVGSEFDYWMDADGNVVFADRFNPETTFVMPEGDAWIQAVYKSTRVSQVYLITKGDGQKHTLKSGKGLSFTCDGPLDKFTGIQVDGVTVDQDNYSVAAGSTVVKFSGNYLDTLAVGKHIVQFMYSDGQSDVATFMVKKAKKDDRGDADDGDRKDDQSDENGDASREGKGSSVPATGDSVTVAPFASAAAIALVVFVIAWLLRRKSGR